MAEKTIKAIEYPSELEQEGMLAAVEKQFADIRQQFSGSTDENRKLRNILRVIHRLSSDYDSGHVKRKAEDDQASKRVKDGGIRQKSANFQLRLVLRRSCTVTISFVAFISTRFVDVSEVSTAR